MSFELEEVGGYIIHVLYDNYDSGKYFPSSIISDSLELNEPLVQQSLDKMTEMELLLKSDEGYRLSEKGYTLTYQRATSYCPHL